MQELINLPGKVSRQPRFTGWYLSGGYTRLRRFNAVGHSCLNSMQAEKCGSSTSDIFNTIWIGWRARTSSGRHPCRDKERLLAHFMTKEYRRTKVSSLCQGAPRGFDHVRPLALPSTQAWRTVIMKHNSTCVFGTVSSSVRSYLHPRWRPDFSMSGKVHATA